MMDAVACWADVHSRNRAADGRFVYGVRTTGVYCLPSCPSRPALRRNVRFYADCAAAEAAGLRACLRCAPRRVGGDAAVAEACRLIAAAEVAPGLAALAAAVGLSVGHFHHRFKQAMGLTPRGYAAGLRGERVRAALSGGGSVTAAIYEAGFGAPSRFYAQAPALLGMQPAAYRRGGAGMQIRYATASCSLGVVLAAATERGVCAIALGDDAGVLGGALRARFAAAAVSRAEEGFGAVLAAVVGLVEQPGAELGVPLDLRGTVFQQRVWRALRAIRPGQTVSYGALAAAIGAPGASRAVARACAANPVAVAIPCHRAVAGDGALRGYRWGVARKRVLLERER